MADVIITSAGLDAVINQSLPKFSIKYFLPIYDQRIDPEIHTALSAGLATDLIPILNAASSADTHETLIGEKLWNFENVGFTSAYNLIDEEFYVYEEASTLVNTSTGFIQLTTQSDTAPVNVLIDNADPLQFNPLSDMVSGTNNPEPKYNNVPGDFYYDNPVELLSSASPVSDTANRDLLWGGVVYAPANPTANNQIAEFQTTIGIKNGSLKFNKGAFYIQKLLSDGSVDNAFDPVLFGEVMFNKTQYIRSDGNGSASINITLALDFIINPGNELFIATDDWVKIPPLPGGQDGLFYYGDVAIGTSGFSGSWEPRAGLEITKLDEPQLKLTKDYINTSVDFEVQPEGYLKISTSGSEHGLAAFGEYSTATGRKSFAAGNSTHATNDFTVAIGAQSDATGIGAGSFGVSNTASGQYAYTFGYSNNAVGTGAITLGYDCDAEGDYSTAIGWSSTAIGEGSLAHGSDSFSRGERSVVIGGRDNDTHTSASDSVIIGGTNNKIHGLNSIGAGTDHSTIDDTSIFGAIFGGELNVVSASCDKSVIIGGISNEITTTCTNSMIINGDGNNIFTVCDQVTIIGGEDNSIKYSVSRSSILGGYKNEISDSANGATILGGNTNLIAFQSENSSIVGGTNNDCYGYNSIVVGGDDNTIHRRVESSVILGGKDNDIDDDVIHSQIIGGRSNSMPNALTDSSGYNTIIGGYSNSFNIYDKSNLGPNHYGLISNSTHSLSFGSANTIIGAGYTTIYGHSTIAIGGSNKLGTNAANGYANICNVIGENNTLTQSRHTNIIGGFNEYTSQNDNSAIIGDKNSGFFTGQLATNYKYDNNHIFGDDNVVYGWNNVSNPSPSNQGYIFGRDNFHYGQNGMLVGFGLHNGATQFNESTSEWEGLNSDSQAGIASNKYFDAITIGCAAINPTSDPAVNYLNLYMPQGNIDSYSGGNTSIRSSEELTITTENSYIYMESTNGDVTINGNSGVDLQSTNGDILLSPKNNGQVYVDGDLNVTGDIINIGTKTIPIDGLLPIATGSQDSFATGLTGVSKVYSVQASLLGNDSSWEYWYPQGYEQDLQYYFDLSWAITTENTLNVLFSNRGSSIDHADTQLRLLVTYS